jgi:hypothetical protein
MNGDYYYDNNGSNAPPLPLSSVVNEIVATTQSAATGAVVAPWALLPVSMWHYLVYLDYSYTTYAQWQFDVMTASIMGSLFATVYRFVATPVLPPMVFDTSRNNNNNNGSKDSSSSSSPANIKTALLIAAFVAVKSLVRVQVPAECAAGGGGGALPLFCAEPLYSLAQQQQTPIGSVAADMGINLVEGLALFGGTALVMNSLLSKRWINSSSST